MIIKVIAGEIVYEEKEENQDYSQRLINGQEANDASRGCVPPGSIWDLNLKNSYFS